MLSIRMKMPLACIPGESRTYLKIKHRRSDHTQVHATDRSTSAFSDKFDSLRGLWLQRKTSTSSKIDFEIGSSNCTDVNHKESTSSSLVLSVKIWPIKSLAENLTEDTQDNESLSIIEGGE